MSFWRPSIKDCLYVVSDINGLYYELKLILSRILPLRKTGVHFDRLILLGNFITGPNASEIIDTILKAKEDNPGQIECLCGDQDLRFLCSIDFFKSNSAKKYSYWLTNGGDSAVLSYYQKSNKGTINPFLIQRNNISKYISKSHIEFVKSLKIYYETDNYIFVHGGCDPDISLDQQDVNALVNDTSVYTYISNIGKDFRCKWNKSVITGGGKSCKQPFISDKLITLDSFDENLYVLELYSKRMFSARKGNARLVQELIT